MRSIRFLSAVLAAPAVFLFSSWSHALQAPDAAGCGDGPACAYGFECTVVATSGCAPTPACAPGSSCPEPEPCEAKQEYGCAPAHCQQNEDCASGMVCHEWAEQCPVTDCACAPEEKCDCGPPIDCEPSTVKMCTPRYVLPCEAATDCGAGFTCQETQSCGCSGSGGSEVPPSPGSGAAPLPPDDGENDPPTDPLPPDCSCEPSGVKQCVPQEITCETDAACPAGWTCEAGDVASAPACDGDNCGTLPEPVPSTPTCQPPYYGGNSGGGDLGQPVATPETPDDGGKGTGAPNAGTDTGSNAGSGESNESSACQFGPPSTGPGALGALALLGTLLGVARRRRVK